MNANNRSLNANYEPRTIKELIALAREIRAKFAKNHQHMTEIISKVMDKAA